MKKKPTYLKNVNFWKGRWCLWLGFGLFFVFFLKLASSLKTELWAVPVVLIYLILA